MDADGRPEIDCAGQGVLFVVAHSDLTVDDVKLTSPELRSLFVPRVEDHTPALMCGIQVNFLKCGGVALGTALHHVAIDAVSAFHFFQTWSAFSKDGDAAGLELPCHDRTLLRARSPPFFLDKEGLAPAPFYRSTRETSFLQHALGGARVCNSDYYKTRMRH
jgi:shikimate O-hydroxycinnamoyltransferase